MMRIAIIDTIGLPYDGTTLTKKGLGGSESAVIHMARELSSLGHEVRVFNDCDRPEESIYPGTYDLVDYHPRHEIASASNSDIIIVSRSVAPLCPTYYPDLKLSKELHDEFEIIRKSNAHKILWMHDTFCDGDNLIEGMVLDGYINEIFTLSDWHTSYVTTCDHGEKRDFSVLKNKIWQTRNGINCIPNQWVDISKKDPNLFVYNASATKGMVPLIEKVWPRVRAIYTQARLKIIGGYYEFPSGHIDEQQQTVKKFQLSNDPSITGVEFTGVLLQSEISEILTEASYFLYPSAFPETYGISTLEALAHNVPVITCQRGALEEVAIDIASYKIPYPIEKDWATPWLDNEHQIDLFVDQIRKAYEDRYLWQQKAYACNQVRDICSWESVAHQWNLHFHRILGLSVNADYNRRVQTITRKVKEVFGRRFSNPEDGYSFSNKELRIGVIIPVYNAEQYIRRCIESVMAQDYDNYIVHIINDASTDNTKTQIELALDKAPDHIKAKFTFCTNVENKGALYNQYSYYPTDTDITMFLDGDDCLANDPYIFKKYNEIYQEGYEFTYGSCWSMADNIPLIAQEYPPDVRENNTYRDHKFNWNIPYTHLRTVKTKILYDIYKSDLVDKDGNFFRAGGDVALFYALIEKVDPDKIYANPNIVYHYNDLNPLNDYKVNADEQNRNAELIINNTPKKKILCAIPTANSIEPDTFKSIFDLKVPEGYELDFQYFYGYRVDQVRNLIASWVVNGYDYLFAVDHDVTFPSDTLTKMLAHDKDLVSGIYRARLPEQKLEIYDLNQQRITHIPSQLFQIGGCGFGCVLVKKEVFATIGYPQFEYHPALDHNFTVSEDNDFCKKAMDKGFTLWCDPTILCGHIGKTYFNVDCVGSNTVLNRFIELRNSNLYPKESYDGLVKLKEMYRVEPKIIYDVGACVLHWYDAAKHIWPDAEIIPIEAMKEVEELYKMEGIKRYSAGYLISDYCKTEKYYENLLHPGGNSIYKENPEFSPLAEVLFPEETLKEIQATTLDVLQRERNWPKPDMIKMDIQGAELKALEGAVNILEDTKWLWLELQHKDYNIGAPKADEVIEWLSFRGFELIDSFGGSELRVDRDYFFFKSW